MFGMKILLLYYKISGLLPSEKRDVFTYKIFPRTHEIFFLEYSG